MEQDLIDEQLREARQLFKIFDTPQLNITQFREVLEQLGATFENESEFMEYFIPVDLDGDGLVSYEDFKEFVLTQYVDTNGERRASMYQPKDDMMTIEKLTEFRQLFENNKQLGKDKHTYFMDLLVAKQQLATMSNPLKITVEEFNAFFADQIAQKNHYINEQQFSDLISKFEDEILQMAGIDQQVNMPIFVIHEEDDDSTKNFNTQGSDSEKDDVYSVSPDPKNKNLLAKPGNISARKGSTSSSNLTIQSTPEINSQKRKSANNQGQQLQVVGEKISKIDSASKQVFIDFMTNEQRDPEIVLQEIIDDMNDNQKYKSYLYHDEWQKFFGAMKKIVDSICKKCSKFEDESDGLKQKYALAFAEKEDALQKYNNEKERYQKIQLEYEVLERDVEDLFKIEKQFNMMKAKQIQLIQKLEKKQKKISLLKPKVFVLEQENETLVQQRDELDEKLQDTEDELQSLRELFKNEASPDMQKKYQNLRNTFRQSMVRGGGLTRNTQTAAVLSRLSTINQEESSGVNELEQRYLNSIQSLITSKNVLEPQDQRALSVLAQEYVKNKQTVNQLLGDAEEVCLENEKLYIMNQKLLAEVDKRKKINIVDRKRIESLIFELKKATTSQEEMKDNLQVWEFKYLNQELIKQHSDNENFRTSYMNIIGKQEIEPFQQRLSRINTITKSEEDPFTSFDFQRSSQVELGQPQPQRRLGQQQNQKMQPEILVQNTQNEQDFGRATLGDEFDPSRYTTNHSFNDKSSIVIHQDALDPISLQVKQRALTHQNEMDIYKHEDDFYDPLALEQVKETPKKVEELPLRKQTTNKSDDEEEEKDEVMPLEGGQLRNKNIESMIVIKDDPELFSRISMIGEENEEESENLQKKDGDSRKSKAMIEYQKTQDGKKLKELMKKAGRFTSLSSKMIKGSFVGNTRDQSVISTVSKITNFDYLSLRSSANKLFKRVTQFLDRQGENKYQLVIFSDYMYKIDSHLNKTKRILLATQSNVYQLSINLSLIVKIPIKDITGITMIKTSSAMLAIHVNRNFDFLMETIRRTEFLVFLINITDNNGWPRPELVQSNGLKLLKTKKQEIIDFDPSKNDLSKNNKNLFSHLISTNFINASLVGYLDKRSENWFRSWNEKFCVLTNVGLLYYNDPQKRPRNLFPTIDSQIIAVSEGMYNRKYVFQMKSFTYDITFACKSKDDYERWMNQLNRLQKETEEKRRDIMKKQNVKEKKQTKDHDEDRQEIKLIKSSKYMQK